MCKDEFGKAVDKAVFPGLQGGPHEHTIAAKAVCFWEALKPSFVEYSRQIVKNCKVLAETLKKRGINLVSGGSDNHLILIDLIKTVVVGEAGKGKEVAVALEDAGIVVNANTIPFDPSTPFNPSGIRLGTPILTTMGMKEDEMVVVGNWIADVIENIFDEAVRVRVKGEVRDICGKFGVY